LSAPRSTLKNVLGQGRWRKDPGPGLVTPHLVSALATSARGGKRTTRTTLAVGGFSILFVVVIAVFGLAGEGVRDLRSQVVASLTTLVATIAGFYFGAQTAAAAPPAAPAAAPAPVGPPVAPQISAGPDAPQFSVGRAGEWHPVVAGSPPPTVHLATDSGPLPEGLTLDPTTGAISGTPTSPGTSEITLTATNGITPAATLSVSITVT